MLSKYYRLILYARLLYSLTLVTYYNNISQDILENDSRLHPVHEVLKELDDCMTSIESICKAANDAFNKLFMAALTSDPDWNLGLRKSIFIHLLVIQLLHMSSLPLTCSFLMTRGVILKSVVFGFFSFFSG